MASYSAIRDGLKTALETIEGLRVDDTAPGQINPPAAVILPGDPVVSWDSTFDRGSDDFQFIARVLVSLADLRTAQDALDAFLAGSGDSSVKQAVEGDDTLGGVAYSTAVSSARNYGEYSYAGVTYLGVEFVVDISADGAT